MLCPVLVGRDRELSELDETLQAARIGRGAVVFVCGEAGIGKSRLALALAERARAGGVTVAVGRAVEGSSLAFRALGEAVNALLRDHGPPGGRELEPFRASLAPLVPEWVGAPAVAQSGLVLLEGVLRLLRAIARKHALLLVLEDLQWADSDTLAALEYLADNVGSERVLVVGSVRSGVPGVASDRLARLVGRRVATQIELGALNDAAVEEMARAALGLDSVHPAILGALRRRAEGVPFLIEEMLSAYVSAGEDPAGVTEWRITGRIAESLPSSFRDLVRARLATLDDDDARQVLAAAATLGRTFEWSLLMAITGLDRDRVIEGLRSAVTAELLVGGTSDAEGFSFRHALVREAVLGELLPPERSEIAHRAAEAIEDERPGLPGEWCERAAELREVAGDDLGACRLLQESARRALARGALASAESSLRRAREGARGDYVLWMGVYTLLCEVLARAGKTGELVEMSRALVAEWERTMRHAPQSLARMVADSRRAQIHLNAARAGFVGGDRQLVRESLENARRVAPDDEAISAQARSLEAAVLLADGDAERASAEATVALEVAERLGLRDVVVESLDVIATAAAERGEVDVAAGHFARLRDAAAKDGLVLWRLRALAALGALESRRSGQASLLEEAHALAVQAGAVSALAGIELELGWHRLGLAQLSDARMFFTRALDACRLFALPQLPDALLGRAALYALEGKAKEMRSSLRETLSEADDRSDIRTAALAEAEAVLALVGEDRPRARELLDEAFATPIRWRTGKPWFSGLRLLLAAADGESVVREGPTGDPVLDAYGCYAEAIVLGRTGKGDDATALLALADAVMPPGWRRQHAHRVLAEAGLADGWGDPATLAGEALAFFEAAGMRRLADACKKLRRLAGVPVRRSGRGTSTVPASLLPYGVTSREMDVLSLVGRGFSNGDIAAQLFLSPRTVETHVKSLMRKAGTNTRAQLVAFAAQHPASEESENA